MDMTDIVNRRHMRHAHMVNITPRIMTEGMRADFRTVDRISQKVIEKVRAAKTIRATTPAGTDITADLNPDYRWIKTSGLITREKWGNLPGGEVFTTPGNVNGTFVIDGVVGDWLCDQYGLLDEDAADRSPSRTAGSRARARRTCGCARTSGATPIRTKTATASASSRSAPTSSCTR